MEEKTVTHKTNKLKAKDKGRFALSQPKNFFLATQIHQFYGWTEIVESNSIQVLLLPLYKGDTLISLLETKTLQMDKKFMTGKTVL